MIERQSRRASTALFLAVIALVSSPVLIGGFIAIPALLLAKKAFRDSHARVPLMARAAIPVATLAILISIISLTIYVAPRKAGVHPPTSAPARPTTTPRPMKSAI